MTPPAFFPAPVSSHAQTKTTPCAALTVPHLSLLTSRLPPSRDMSKSERRKDLKLQAMGNIASGDAEVSVNVNVCLPLNLIGDE